MEKSNGAHKLKQSKRCRTQQVTIECGYKQVQQLLIEFYSIRALFGTDGSHNATHGSDSPVSAEREIALIFEKDHNDEARVIEVQGLVDEFETHDVCKPDAVDESEKQLAEITKEPATTATAAAAAAAVVEDNADTNNVTVDLEVNEMEPSVDTEHLHTADLVTSQDNVTDLSQKQDDETINAAPKDVEKDKPIETHVAEKEEKEAVVSLDTEVDASLEDTATATADNSATATADTDDGASKEEQIVKVALVEDNVLESVANFTETRIIDATATVTVEAATADSKEITADTTKDFEELDTTASAEKSDTTASDDNTKEDTHTEKNKDTEQIEEESTIEKQDVKMEPEKVVIEAEIVAANIHVDDDHAETKADAETQQESEAIIQEKEAEQLHEKDAVLEPAAAVPATEESLKTEPIAVIAVAMETEEKELSVPEQDKKQEEPVDITIQADIVTASVQDNDEDDTQHQHGVTTDEVVTSDAQQTNVIVVDSSDVNVEKSLDIPEGKNTAEDHQDAKLNESVTQEKEVLYYHPGKTCNIITILNPSCFIGRSHLNHCHYNTYDCYCYYHWHWHKYPIQRQ